MSPLSCIRDNSIQGKHNISTVLEEYSARRAQVTHGQELKGIELLVRIEGYSARRA